jgi:hypothetical protein
MSTAAPVLGMVNFRHSTLPAAKAAAGIKPTNKAAMDVFDLMPGSSFAITSERVLAHDVPALLAACFMFPFEGTSDGIAPGLAEM